MAANSTVAGFTDPEWAVWEPLIKTVPPRGKTLPQDLRQTIAVIFSRHRNGARCGRSRSSFARNGGQRSYSPGNLKLSFRSPPHRPVTGGTSAYPFSNSVETAPAFSTAARL